MTINPVINCQDEATATSHFKAARELIGEGGVVHVDIADGSFTNGYVTWGDPASIKKLISETKLRVALHLMVAKPKAVLEKWLASGISRIIIHYEAIKKEEAALVAGQCHAHGVQPYLGITPGTSITEARADISLFDGCLVLAVNPGLSGQQFQEGALAQITEIKTAMPLLPIAVDGGITPEVAKRCRDAGAKQIAVGAYIFNASDPKAAYQEFIAAVGD